ncbi:MAG: DNA repair protein RecN [Elusimicrobia bacterium]|nr:DNA repair protein RecN [Elusimicrobiota bacterium]
MIELLDIHNFAIIKELTVKFSDGLNVFTGETGAGKSIIVESVASLFGSKIYSKLEQPLMIRGVFKLSEPLAEKLSSKRSIEIKRVVETNGRSKYYVNSKPESLAYISNISKFVIDFHSQMENDLIFSPSKQIEIVDSYSNTADELKKFQELYHKKIEIENRIKNISLSEEERARLLDLYTYQYNEINTADIKENEDIEIEEMISIYKNSAKIKKILDSIKKNIDDDGGIKSLVYNIIKNLEELSTMDSSHTNLNSQAEAIETNSKLLSEEVTQLLSRYNFNDIDIDKYIERDELIKKLKKKYAPDIKGINEKKIELLKKIEELSQTDEKKENLNKEIINITNDLEKLSKVIDKKRKKSAQSLSDEIFKELKRLGFEHSSFKIMIDEADEYNQYGKNTVEFLFTANPDQLLKPIKYIASGGEISRIVLAIKTVFSEKSDSSTLIFDEIDSGIGGNTAFAVGKAVSKISKNKQILLITHMPQVAIYADKHFKVVKNYKNQQTYVDLVELNSSDERVKEIARMLGSSYSEDTAINHAKKLLNNIKD